MNIENNNNITFIIDTLQSIDDRYKGGSIVLHKLAFELANMGHFVYLFCDPIYPHQNIKIIPTIVLGVYNEFTKVYEWDPFFFDLNKTVSIYTQITRGNPFNTLYNTRWILHDCEEELWDTFGEDDFFCNFGNFELIEHKDCERLTVIDYNLNTFYDKKLSERKGFGHLVHKNTPEWGIEFLKNFGSSEILNYNGNIELNYYNDEFNKYEYILTFDDKSYFTTAAALSGAKSIILNPKPNLSSWEYRLENPINMFGVAYGLNDIKWADRTINLVRNHLKELEMSDKKTVVNFVKYWENRLEKL